MALELSELEVTVLIGGTGLLSFAGFFVAERLVAAHGHARTVALCGILSMIAGLAYYSVPSAKGLPAAWLLAGLLIGLSNAAISTFQSTVNGAYPTNLLARIHGLLQLVGALSAIAAQVLLAGAIGVFDSLLQAILVVGSLKALACPIMLTWARTST